MLTPVTCRRSRLQTVGAAAGPGDEAPPAARAPPCRRTQCDGLLLRGDSIDALLNALQLLDPKRFMPSSKQQQQQQRRTAL
eukprot:scaffold60573_cov18-Tisochrysis_lutea.AAC.1